MEKNRRAAYLLLLLFFEGKERRCLSRLKWAEKNVKEQNLLPYFKTASLRVVGFSKRQGGEGRRRDHIKIVRIAREVA